MILIAFLMAAAPARALETSQPEQVKAAAPAAGPSLPSLPQLPGSALPQLQPPGLDRFWEGAQDIAPKGKPGPQLPYWKTAFEENARIAQNRAAFQSVPGLAAVSQVFTRNHQGVPTPGLQLALEHAADMAQVLTKMAAIDPVLKSYRLIESRTPGERQIVYLVRPSRTGLYRDPKEAAALAQEKRDDARFTDALRAASGSVAPIDYGRQEKILVQTYIEKPEVFDSRSQALRYIVLGENPEGMLSDPESLPHYLARAIADGGVRRFWNGTLGGELQQVGFYQQRRPLVVALSPEAPADVAQPTAVYGLPAELKAFQVSEGQPRRFAPLRGPMKWVAGWTGLAVTGALGFGLLPATIAGLVWLYRASAGMFFLGFVLSLFIGPYFALAFRDSLSWTIRMLRLYRAIPKA